ncbi:7-cyano-7-deazaguanine synthase [Virgisporangium ochraceum]|uniref:7-cyano-7-deazaguanine synthase n=1 Tax=Virgisporangium ochraceum TaxID=65505 RepID=UPI001940E7E1|nr:7-cyano-7-deazaguanine synthase [Virgisporangium ochraceum]
MIVNDCASPPVRGLTHLRTRDTDYGPQNATFVYDRVVNGLPDRLTPLQQDWLDILSALFAADLTCLRGAERDWARDIEIWIGVRQPDHWRPLADHFRRVFSALTYDRIQINFEAAASHRPPPRQHNRAFRTPTAVALLSGGLDSLVGGGRLVADGEIPLFVSHQNSGIVGRALESVTKGIDCLGPTSGRRSFTAQVHGTRTENTQRSRSMLYMGVACLMASSFDLPDVYLNENGIMAINAALTEARAGSYSTRTASPPVVREFGRLASRALDHPLTVRNLLVRSTKPEVVQDAVDLSLESVVPETVSCWSIGRRAKHCGYCVPCLVRQISCEYTGVTDAPYKHRPLDDIPDSAPWRRTAMDNIVHLGAQVTAIAEADDAQLELDLTDLVNGGDQITRDESFEMHRRWADQAIAVLRAHPVSARLLGI